MDIKIPRKSQANSKDKPASLINPKKKITPTPPSINIKNSKTGKKTKKSNLNRFHLLKNLNGFFFIWALLFIVLYIRTPSAINNSRNIKSLLSQSGSLSEIFGNIAYAPLKLVIFSLDKLGILNIFSLRIMLAAIIFISLFFFYRVCLMWTRRKTAWLITLMLSTSTFFLLNIQNLGFDNVMLLFFPLSIFIFYLSAYNTSYKQIIPLGVLYGCLLYNPGTVWLILSTLILSTFFFRRIIAARNLRFLVAFLLSGFAVLLPLIISVSLKPANNLHNLISDSPGISFSYLAANLKSGLDALFISGISDGSLWLSGTPIIGFVTSALILFGVIYLVFEPKLKKHFLLFLNFGLFSLVLLAFNGINAIQIMYPLLFFVAAFGIKLLLDRWFSIFPSNPVAKNIGYGAVIAIVVISCSYNVIRYHIGWDQSLKQVSQRQ